jgi:hypothetical protein
MNANISIYIPRLSIHVCESFVKEQFEKNHIGHVRRIDFTPIGKKPGFDENVCDVVKSAFIHFYHFYAFDKTVKILEKLSRGESDKIYLPNNGYGYQEYWILLKATNPIQDTMMNNAQIVENCRFLEKKIKDQDETIKDQDETIKDMQEEIKSINKVVYDLIGGLFCQDTQRATQNSHLKHLFPQVSFRPDKDTNKWKNYPTTRQGDECESRIDALEAIIKEITNFDSGEEIFQKEYNNSLNDYLNSQENHTVSTHSSMPGLVDNDQDTVSTHSSMPGLVEDNDQDTVSTHSSMPGLVEEYGYYEYENSVYGNQ